MTVREAERAHRRAVEHLHRLEENAGTDLSVTAVDLVVARADVDLAARRVDGAKRLQREAEDAERRRLQEQGTRQRARREAAARADELANEQRAIESGKAEQDLTELYHDTHSPDAARRLAQIRAWKASGSDEWPGYDQAPVPA